MHVSLFYCDETAVVRKKIEPKLIGNIYMLFYVLKMTTKYDTKCDKILTL